MEVMVAVVEERLKNRREHARLVLAEVVATNEIERCAGFGIVVIMPAGIIKAATLRDLLGGETEEEKVVLAGGLGHLNGRAVARADGKRAVHHEFHVAGATGFVTSGGYLLRHVAGGE